MADLFQNPLPPIDLEEDAAPPGRRPRPPRPPRAPWQPPAPTGDPGIFGSFNMAQALTGQQGGHLAGMINQAAGAIDAENKSRVAQMREMQRQEHEKELMRMQMEAQKRASDADLIRSLLAGS